MNFFFERVDLSQLCRLTKRNERKRERENSLAAFFEQNKSLTFVQFLIYVCVYVYILLSIEVTAGEDFHSVRYSSSNDTISIFDRICRKSGGGRLFWQTKGGDIYIYIIGER